MQNYKKNVNLLCLINEEEIPHFVRNDTLIILKRRKVGAFDFIIRSNAPTFPPTKNNMSFRMKQCEVRNFNQENYSLINFFVLLKSLPVTSTK